MLGVVFVALVLAALQIYGEVRGWRTQRSAIRAKADIAGALTETGLPIASMLGKVAEARLPDERRAEAVALIYKAVGIAQQQCGKLAGIRCNTRASFYQFVSSDKLELIHWEGRQGRAPRADFVAGRSANDARVINRARGDDALLVVDVGKASVEEYERTSNAEYRSFLLVPVKTNKRSYGFLSVDSNRAKSLLPEDVGYAKLIAGAMAAVFALLEGDHPSLPEPSVVP